jgi:hypothetical protein
MEFRLPWEVEPKGSDPRSRVPGQAGSIEPTFEAEKLPKPRGRRPADAMRGMAQTGGSPTWLCHHLIVSGPADAVTTFAAAARGAGVTPWRLDGGMIEEDIFNMAATQPAADRNLTIAGCRILARQFRERVEHRHGRAFALVGRSQACPFDLHELLPVPDAVLELGPTHPDALAWLAAHWGIIDRPRQVALLRRPKPDRRLPQDHVVIGYGFFTADATPTVAVARLAERWPALHFLLRPRPLD